MAMMLMQEGGDLPDAQYQTFMQHDQPIKNDSDEVSTRSSRQMHNDPARMTDAMRTTNTNPECDGDASSS